MKRCYLGYIKQIVTLNQSFAWYWKMQSYKYRPLFMDLMALLKIAKEMDCYRSKQNNQFPFIYSRWNVVKTGHLETVKMRYLLI